MKLRIWDSLLDTGLVVSNCKLLEVERIQLSWWLRLGPSTATAHSFQSPFLTPELNNFHLIIPIIAAGGRCSLLPTIWMALTLSLITSWSPEMDVPIRPCPVQSSAAPDTTPEMWKGPNGPYPAQCPAQNQSYSILISILWWTQYSERAPISIIKRFCCVPI